MSLRLDVIAGHGVAGTTHLRVGAAARVAWVAWVALAVAGLLAPVARPKADSRERSTAGPQLSWTSAP